MDPQDPYDDGGAILEIQSFNDDGHDIIKVYPGGSVMLQYSYNQDMNRYPGVGSSKGRWVAISVQGFTGSSTAGYAQYLIGKFIVSFSHFQVFLSMIPKSTTVYVSFTTVVEGSKKVSYSVFYLLSPKTNNLNLIFVTFSATPLILILFFQKNRRKLYGL